MKVLVIGDPTTCMAFSLGGIMTRSVTGSVSAREALQAAADNEQVGLILITERVASLVRPEVEVMLDARHLPLVVEIPDDAGPVPGRPTAGELMVNLMDH